MNFERTPPSPRCLQVAGLGHVGAIAVGKRADIVCFSAGGLPRGNHTKLWLDSTLIAGKVAFSRS